MIPDSFNLEYEPTSVKESLAVIPQAGTLDLRLADCMDVMKEFPDKHFDLAIVDPPYGIGIVSQFKKITESKSSMMRGMNGITGGEWDSATPNGQYFAELRRVSKNQIIWGGNYFIDHLNSTRCFLSWDKMNGTNNMADFELAWTSFDSSCRRFAMHHFSTGYDTKIHPTQKPVALYKWLLKNYATPGQRILDTHLGSGSHAIACHYAGMHLTACEIDADYFEAAKERIKRETSQLDLFC
jgi:site-specific DNA-methyltransferase (adenine-specific)